MRKVRAGPTTLSNRSCVTTSPTLDPRLKEWPALTRSAFEVGVGADQRGAPRVFEERETLDGASGRARCGCLCNATGNIYDPEFVFSSSELLQPLSHSSHLPDPASPARHQPHLMLMKLPEDMCTCSARISSSFTPAARLRGLEVGGRQRKEGRDPLATFLKQATSRAAEQPIPPVYFASGCLLSASCWAGQPNPRGIGRLPQAGALTSGQ